MMAYFWANFQVIFMRSINDNYLSINKIIGRPVGIVSAGSKLLKPVFIISVFGLGLFNMQAQAAVKACFDDKK